MTTSSKSNIFNSEFARHVAEGLSAPQAFLSSKFIYDERGSKLFQDIMNLEEYYLTRSEFEILSASAKTLHQLFSSDNSVPYELIELGAGDGAKTKLLLAEAMAAGGNFVYRPVDISPEILEELAADLFNRFPGIRVEPIATSYLKALELLSESTDVRRVVLFMGSNIGNFPFEQAKEFCGAIGNTLAAEDFFMLGVDLKKDPRLILAAYDDSKGVTAAFNLNLLHRINRELGGNFDVDAWGFYPLYNPESGEVRSYLYPTREQHVSIPGLSIERTFLPGEVIHSEVSRKYSLAELEQLAQASGCQQAAFLQDSKGYFADVVWKRRRKK